MPCLLTEQLNSQISDRRKCFVEFCFDLVDYAAKRDVFRLKFPDALIHFARAPMVQCRLNRCTMA